MIFFFSFFFFAFILLNPFGIEFRIFYGTALFPDRFVDEHRISYECCWMLVLARTMLTVRQYIFHHSPFLVRNTGAQINKITNRCWVCSLKRFQYRQQLVVSLISGRLISHWFVKVYPIYICHFICSSWIVNEISSQQNAVAIIFFFTPVHAIRAVQCTLYTLCVCTSFRCARVLIGSTHATGIR